MSVRPLGQRRRGAAGGPRGARLGAAIADAVRDEVLDQDGPVQAGAAELVAVRVPVQDDADGVLAAVLGEVQAQRDQGGRWAARVGRLDADELRRVGPQRGGVAGDAGLLEHHRDGSRRRRRGRPGRSCVPPLAVKPVADSVEPSSAEATARAPAGSKTATSKSLASAPVERDPQLPEAGRDVDRLGGDALRAGPQRGVAGAVGGPGGGVEALVQQGREVGVDRTGTGGVPAGQHERDRGRGDEQEEGEGGRSAAHEHGGWNDSRVPDLR